MRKLVRAYLRKKAAQKRLAAERERRWAELEMEYQRKLEEKKDEAFYALESAIIMGGLGRHNISAHEILHLSECISLNGWRYVSLDERAAA